jgi:hypothetical protein
LPGFLLFSSLPSSLPTTGSTNGTSSKEVQALFPLIKRQDTYYFSSCSSTLVVFALGNFTSMFLVTLPTFSTRNTESDLNRMFHIHLDHEQIAMVGLTMAVVFSLITILLPPTCCRDYTKTKQKAIHKPSTCFCTNTGNKTQLPDSQKRESTSLSRTKRNRDCSKSITRTTVCQ